MNDVGIEAQQQRGVGKADIGNTANRLCTDGIRQRTDALEGLQTHGFVDLDEEELVPAPGITRLPHCFFYRGHFVTFTKSSALVSKNLV